MPFVALLDGGVRRLRDAPVVELGEVEPGFLAFKAAAANAGLPRSKGTDGRRDAAFDFSATGLCRRGAKSEKSAGASRCRQHVPAARRRLRRELCGARRQ